MNSGAPKYWAFISYSHRDTRVATALQHALETYRLPRSLVGTRNAAGTVPARLRPVFLDRGDLQASTDLKGVVHEALAQSRFLIVVCSPDAARSAWVNQEIVEFKKLHGESRVLAVIAAGEPFARRMPGREAEECFPEALRLALTPAGRPGGEELEPIAADLRPHGDGKRRAVLKLAAGMVGVGADELIRREAQRRARRLALVAAASVAGMAVMAVLTVTAVRSRNEAQSQRAQAEDLLEFMLGDLRKKLEPVGRLDVLDGVGEKALGYYAKQEADRLDANALGRRSRALHLIGQMREQRGQLEAALGAFDQAIAAQHEKSRALRLVPNAATNKNVQRQLQNIAYELARLELSLGRLPAAVTMACTAVQQAQQLVAADPQNKFWLEQLAFAQGLLAEAQGASGDLAAARGNSRAQLEGCAKLAALDPTVANWHVNLRGRALILAAQFAADDDARGARIDEFAAYLAKAREFATTDLDANRPREIIIAEAELTLGNLLARDGRGDQARERWRTSAARVQIYAEHGDLPAMTVLAHARFRLGEIEPARQLAPTQWSIGTDRCIPRFAAGCVNHPVKILRFGVISIFSCAGPACVRLTPVECRSDP